MENAEWYFALLTLALLGALTLFAWTSSVPVLQITYCRLNPRKVKIRQRFYSVLLCVLFATVFLVAGSFCDIWLPGIQAPIPSDQHKVGRL